MGKPRLDIMDDDQKAARASIRRADVHLRAAERHARKGEWGDMRDSLDLAREIMAEAEGVADDINEPR